MCINDQYNKVDEVLSQHRIQMMYVLRWNIMFLFTSMFLKLIELLVPQSQTLCGSTGSYRGMTNFWLDVGTAILYMLPLHTSQHLITTRGRSHYTHEHPSTDTIRTASFPLVISRESLKENTRKWRSFSRISRVLLSVFRLILLLRCFQTSEIFWHVCQ